MYTNFMVFPYSIAVCFIVVSKNSACFQHIIEDTKWLDISALRFENRPCRFLSDLLYISVIKSYTSKVCIKFQFMSFYQE
jgi:hypothetical protein